MKNRRVALNLIKKRINRRMELTYKLSKRVNSCSENSNRPIPVPVPAAVDKIQSRANNEQIRTVNPITQRSSNLLRNLSGTLSESVAAACLLLITSFLELLKYNSALNPLAPIVERDNEFSIVSTARTNPFLFGYESSPEDDKLS